MSGPNGDPEINIDEEIINDEDEFNEDEYTAINSMLDQINSYLDGLEERNDALNGKLLELLESNRQARLEFRAQLIGSPMQEENLPADIDATPPSKQNLDEDTGGK